MKRLLLSFALLLIFALSMNCGSGDSKTENDTVRIPVEVMPIQLGNLVQSLNFNGDIKAEFEVKVFSKIPDRIEKFYVDDGSYVAQGAPIARIFAITIEQAVRQAEAGLAAAKAQEANLLLEYDRAQRLYKESAMSKQQFDAVETQYKAVVAQVEQSEAMFKSAKSQLSDATVTAPIAGIIGKRYYEAGDMANPAMPLVTIVQMARVKITFDATEEDLGRLAVGQKANVMVKSYSDRAFEGKVVKISPVLDPLTRMAEVEVLIDNPGGLLKPGMFAKTEVVTGVLTNVITVPRYATIETTVLEKAAGEDQAVTSYQVFVVKDDKAEQRKLTVNYVNHVQMAVSNGVQAGELLVIAGQANLRDGTAVVVAKGGANL